MSWRARFGAPLIIGHRGSSGRIVENTVEAFVAAVEDGADGVELDVQLCKSGEVVVFHDKDLRRLLGDPRRVAQVELAELQRLRLSGGQKVPTLDEVFGALPDGFRVNVELKAPGPAQNGKLVLGVLAVLKRHPRIDVLCSSFDPSAVWLLSRQDRRLPLGLLFHERQSRPLRRGWLTRIVGATAVHPQACLVTPLAVTGWRRRGFGINVWTVDDPAEGRRLLNLGVDAIITNQPKPLRAALSSTYISTS